MDIDLIVLVCLPLCICHKWNIVEANPVPMEETRIFLRKKKIQLNGQRVSSLSSPKL